MKPFRFLGVCMLGFFLGGVTFGASLKEITEGAGIVVVTALVQMAFRNLVLEPIGDEMGIGKQTVRKDIPMPTSIRHHKEGHGGKYYACKTCNPK